MLVNLTNKSRNQILSKHKHKIDFYFLMLVFINVIIFVCFIFALLDD